MFLITAICQDKSPIIYASRRQYKCIITEDTVSLMGQKQFDLLKYQSITMFRFQTYISNTFFVSSAYIFSTFITNIRQSIKGRREHKFDA